MRFLTQTVLGGPEVITLADGPAPTLKHDEVLIKVAAAGLNPVDASVREGTFNLIGEPPFTLGWDVAGVVEAVGESVSAFKVGDRAFGMPRFPAAAATHAEYVAAPAGDLAHTPATITDVQAAALPLAALTAYQALVETAQIKANDRVLIHGAAGGVGHLAVQIAKSKGAEVIATASAEKMAFVREIGADVVIDYKTQDFTASGPFDVVLDTISGETQARSIDAARAQGVVVALLPIEEDMAHKAQAANKRLINILVHPSAANLQALIDLIQQRRLSVTVAGEFTFEQAAQAYAALQNKPVGKIVLKP